MGKLGNPPFTGGKNIRERLGNAYAEALWVVHKEINYSISRNRFVAACSLIFTCQLSIAILLPPKLRGYRHVAGSCFC